MDLSIAKGWRGAREKRWRRGGERAGKGEGRERSMEGRLG